MVGAQRMVGGPGRAYLACAHCDVLLILLVTLEYSLRVLRSPILVVSTLLLRRDG